MLDRINNIDDLLISARQCLLAATYIRYVSQLPSRQWHYPRSRGRKFNLRRSMTLDVTVQDVAPIYSDLIFKLHWSLNN